MKFEISQSGGWTPAATAKIGGTIKLRQEGIFSWSYRPILLAVPQGLPWT